MSCGEWLDKIENDETLGQREKELVKRACKVLKNNVFHGEKLAWGDRRIVVPSEKTYFGAWNWDSAFIAVALSEWDTNLAFEQCKIFLDYQKADGMFIDAIMADGTFADKTGKPPVLATALMKIHQRDENAFSVAFVYEKLKKNVSFWETKRAVGGLFHYDADCDKTDENYELYCKWESGLDDSVRFDNGAHNLFAVDLNCFMIMFYDAMIYFANFLGIESDAEDFRKKKDELGARINEKLWCEEVRSYCDFDYENGRFSPVLSPACFMPLYVGIAPRDRAIGMANIAADENKFYPLMPTVSYDDPAYSADSFWRGPTWLNVAFFAAKGLQKAGIIDLYARFRENILSACHSEKRGIFEYYNSKSGEGLGAGSFAWSAVFIILFALNKDFA